MRFTYCSPSREATATFIESYATRFAEDGFAPWTAVLAAEQRIVGWGGLARDPKAPHWGVEVLYFFDPSCWGRGLATELVSASQSHGFRDLGLSVINAFVRPENHGSVRVLAMAGFTRIRFVPELERDAFQSSAALWEVE